MSNIEKVNRGNHGLEVTCFKEINGLEMGVLSDGTAFLSERGLAEAAGVDKTSIANLSKAYACYGDGGKQGQKSLRPLINMDLRWGKFPSLLYGQGNH